MRQLRQLIEMFNTIPRPVQFVIAAALVAFSLASLYGRINTRFGAKVFSRVEESQIRRNVGHILQYTVVPIIVTAAFVALLVASLAG